MKKIKILNNINNKSIKVSKEGVSPIFIEKIIEAQKKTLKLNNRIKSKI